MKISRFLNRKTTWTNTELAWVKVCVASAYLIVGTYFHEFFGHYLLIAGVVFLITVVRAMWLWMQKLKVHH